MTNPSPGPSLPQARGAAPHPHSLPPRHHHDSIHGHHRHGHLRRRQSFPGAVNGEKVEPADDGHETQESSTSVGPDDPNGVGLSESPADAVKGVDSSPPIGVAQNASPSPLNSTSSALHLRSAIETPQTLLAGSVLGNTVAIPTSDSQATAAIHAAALDISSGSTTSPTSSSSAVATTSASITTAPTTSLTSATSPTTTESTSISQTPDPTTTPPSSPSIYPNIGDLHNGTHTISHGNSSFVPASLTSSKSSSITLLSLKPSSSLPSSNSSQHGVSALSSPTTLSFTTSTGERTTSTGFSTTSTELDGSGVTSVSASAYASSTTLSDTTSTYYDGGLMPTSVAGGVRPPSSPGSNTNTGGPHGMPEPQKARIIGSVCGSVAGVAFLAVLVLLALRYKKRRDAGALLGSGRLGSTASGTLTGGDSMTMTERSGPSAVPAPFTNLTRKRSSHQPANSVDEGGERGFYRVAGRKLPPVLITGGDGYSDPRESVMSAGSDYYRGSQAFDLAAAGAPRQLVLGAPMRPVSGVPVMRSGPARTPVTENPFADPMSPPATQDAPNRRPVSRASASKFHESI